MPSERLNERTRREWRELGFFYDRDDDVKAWRIVGSSVGLLRFSQALARYAADPKNQALSEHQHFGPYLYLEVGTWDEPEITSHWVAGSPAALLALSQAVAEAVPRLSLNESVSLRPVYSPRSPYDLVIERRVDGFDPAREDPLCW